MPSPKAADQPDDTPTTPDEDLSELNRRIADEAAAATTADKRRKSSS